MTSAGKLLFGGVPSFPTVWILGLLGFVALWWYVCRAERRLRRIFLALWLPAALGAQAVYSLDGRGLPVTESLRRIVHRDPTLLPLVHWLPTSGWEATYAMVVGGTVAVLATMALQLAGLVFGTVLGLVPSARLNPPHS